MFLRIILRAVEVKWKNNNATQAYHGDRLEGAVGSYEGVSRGAINAEEGGDIAGVHSLEVLEAVNIHATEAGHAKLLSGASVAHHIAATQTALVHPGVRQLAELTRL